MYNVANAVKQHSRSSMHTPTTSTPRIRSKTPALSNNNNNNANTAPPRTTTITHNTRAHAAAGGPTLNDPDLSVERIVDIGLKSTTSMAFLGPDDILVLQKDTGIVHRILNGKLLPEPVLDVNVANKAERGLLGIAVAKGGESNGNTEKENGNGEDNGNTRHIFLYYTESGGGKDGDDAPTADNIEPAGNRLLQIRFG